MGDNASMLHPERTPEGPLSERGLFWALGRLVPYLLEFKGRMVVAFGLMFAAKGANALVPQALKALVDGLGSAPLWIAPGLLVAAYALFRFLNVGFGELRDGLFARVGQRVVRRASLQVFEHLFRLSLRFHLDRRTGGLSRDIERGSRGISSLLNATIFNVLPTVFEILLVAGILFVSYRPVYGLITLGILVMYFVYTMLVSDWRIGIRRTMNEMDSHANAHAVDSLLNYETVRYFNNERYEAARYDQSLQSLEDATVRSETSLAWLNAGQALIIALGVAALMYLAVGDVHAQAMTVGDLVAVNAYLLQVFIPLNLLGMVYRNVRTSVTDMERFFVLLDKVPEVADRPDAVPLRIRQGEIRFDHVDFHYDPDRAILHDVSFAVPAGRKLAVVGPSGAGKSTLARLLFRYYDVVGGSISIDGQDIRELTQESLRATIGIVPQDTVLFNDTILANIRYGRPEASQQEIVAAARAAHIHDFIAALPKGYDTLVGERGLKLSGGEKQRVAIARALLKNPQILVFDEATSALDTRVEKAIQAQLNEIARDRTTLVIAHRLSTVVDADEILVLDRGRVVERGSHADLLARRGLYAEMWAMQQAEEHRVPAMAHAGRAI
jgi:ATP-binding cassette, subfamily B, heavy metal transporter